MSNIWCNRCHKLLATPWCPNCDRPGELTRQALDEGYQAVESALGPDGVRALVEEWNTARARVKELEGRIRRCEDCDATMNHIGNGIFECWKCTEAETRGQLAEAQEKRKNAATAAGALGLARDEEWLRAEAAEAQAAMLRGVLEKAQPIIKEEADRRDYSPIEDGDGIANYSSEMRILDDEITQALSTTEAAVEKARAAFAPKENK